MEVEDKCVFLIIVMQKYVKKALEWRRETQQKSICAVRTRQRSFKPRRELDTYYRARGWKHPFGFSVRFPAGMEAYRVLEKCFLVLF